MFELPPFLFLYYLILPAQMTIENAIVKVKIGENAIKPIKFGAGYILCSAQSVKIQPNTKLLVSSGISMVIPLNYYGQLHTIDNHIGNVKLLGGVIDSDYRGDIRCILYNETETEFTINEGDPICKIIFVKINTEQIECVESLTESERGAGGFGSTGK